MKPIEIQIGNFIITIEPFGIGFIVGAIFGAMAYYCYLY